MKIRTLLLIGICMLAFSCESLLEENPPSLLSPETIYNSVENIELGVNGVYDVLGKPFVDGRLRWGNYHRALVVMGTIGTDVGQARGPNSTNVQHTLNYFNYGPNDIIPSEVYRVHYVGINLANTMINRIQIFRNSNPEDAEKLNQLEAQSRFLRALYYFNLVRYYGPVPLKTTETASLTADDVVSIARNPVIDIYNQIEEDLLFAEENLPLPSEIPTSSYGRASKTAAWALLARVYNTWATYPLKDESKWASSVEYCERIINSGEHSLLSVFDEVFATRGGAEINEEIIFSVRYSEAPGETGALGSQTGNWGPAYLPGGFASEAAIVLERDFHESFQAGDTRYETTVGNFRLTPANDTVFWTNGFQLNNNVPMIKWARDGTFVAYDSPYDYPLLRYADVLLMYAEATAQANGGPTADSYDAINQVRSRAFEGDPSANLDGLSPAEFIDAVLQERKWELCAEDGSRWHDLIRYEQLTVETLSKKNRWNTGAGIQNFFDPETHKLFPIPQLEVNTNPLMTQNPGY
ncbi:MAG: RagB/SusD family nutrient uptake outer membrane protein [Bacteroidota bacterium]